GAFAVKLRSPSNQFFDSLRCILYQNFCSFRIAQAVASAECVLQMKADFIFIAERRRDSTLRILCAGVRDLPLNQHCDFPSRRQPPSAVRSSMARQKSNLPGSWLLTTDG